MFTDRFLEVSAGDLVIGRIGPSSVELFIIVLP